MVDLRDSSEKIQTDVGAKNEKAEELIEELKILIKASEKNIACLEKVNTSFNRAEINISSNHTTGPRNQRINSVLDLIDNRWFYEKVIKNDSHYFYLKFCRDICKIYENRGSANVCIRSRIKC